MTSNLPEPSQGQKRTLTVTGMDCAACAMTVEKGVQSLEGVTFASVNFATESLTIIGEVSQEQIFRRVQDLGYGIQTDAPEAAQDLEQKGNFWTYIMSRPKSIFILVGAVLLIPGIIFNELLPHLGIELLAFDIMAIGALIIAGYPVGRSAYQAIRINREININVLMSIAAIGAVILGAFVEAGMVMVLFALGETLEAYSANQARQSIRGLMSLAPQTAVVLRPCMDCMSHLGQGDYSGGPCPFCGEEPHSVHISDLKIGETMIVKAGERIPMDGLISSGLSSVNQAPITGESQPIAKQPGDQVFAGTINGESLLEIKITHFAKDNTISRLIRLVEEAQENKAPAQKFVDRFAQIYTPIVAGLAVLVAIVPPILWGAPFWNTPGVQGWFYRALELLVIACPCALVISTPVSLISSITNAARHGVLIKGGLHMETLSRVRAFAFDKTGTLTQGMPSLRHYKAVNCTLPGWGSEQAQGSCDPCTQLLALATAVEAGSEHTIATAFAHPDPRMPEYAHLRAKNVKTLPGIGVAGTIDDHTVMVGSHRHFDQTITHPPAICDEIETAARSGQTAMLVSRDGQYLGYLTVADQPRPESKEALEQLRSAGVEEIIMLTGDNATTARHIAEQVGITRVEANLLPEEKLATIRQLTNEFETVAMVGDGINDAPALAAAAIGIAIGAVGEHARHATDQAMETADIVLMQSGLTALPFAYRLSKRTMQTIRTNIILAIGIKVVFLALALLGLGSMWLAVFADVGASLIVTINGMRLLNYRDR